jgi:hypothetical protein
MTLRTITRLWLFSRYIHTILGGSLWVPISHRTLFWSAVIFGPWNLLLGIIGLPYANIGLTVHLFLPGLATWWVCRMVDGGTRPDELVRSWLVHGLAYLRYKPRPYRSVVRVVWR